ncbi:MAG: ABC transporter permease [Bacteroidales bacterium]|nr:ABC transporter permease [Bacteroidales bacterium]
MRTFLFLLEKEFKQILRNRIILAMIIALPTIQLAILPHAATYEIRHINLAVVDADHSTLSAELTAKLNASRYFNLVSDGTSYEDALELVEDGKAHLILEIPPHFEKDLRLASKAGLMIAVDAVDGTMGSIGSSYLNQILQSFTAGLVARGEIAYPEADGPQARIQVIPQYRYNTQLDYKTYMVPGILVMLLTLVGGILAALNIVSEKEQGTLEQINVSPVPKQSYLLAKVIPFWIIGLLTLAIGLLIARFLYGIVPAGSLLTLYTFAAVYVVAFTGFGLLISVAAKTQQQSMFIAFFFLLIFFLMGGLFTPISSMPYWAQVITWFNPTAYLIDVVRLIVMKGSGFADLVPQFFCILGFAVVFNVWAIFGYDKTA